MPSNTTKMSDEELRSTSHDLKNDLASILALAEMIQFSLTPEQLKTQKKNFDRLKARVFEATERVDTTFKLLRQKK